jgi:hypothetical protein
MKSVLQRILLLIILVIAPPVGGSSRESTTHVWTFDNDPPGSLPAEFQMAYSPPEFQMAYSPRHDGRMPGPSLI